MVRNRHNLMCETIENIICKDNNEIYKKYWLKTVVISNQDQQNWLKNRPKIHCFEEFFIENQPNLYIPFILWCFLWKSTQKVMWNYLSIVLNAYRPMICAVSNRKRWICPNLRGVGEIFACHFQESDQIFKLW